MKDDPEFYHRTLPCHPTKNNNSVFLRCNLCLGIHYNTIHATESNLRRLSPARIMATTPGRRRKLKVDPVSQDIGLKKLLTQKIGDLQSEDEWNLWYVSVIGRYEAFVDQNGLVPAREAEENVLRRVAKFGGLATELTSQIASKRIRKDYLGVKGNNLLNKIQDESSEGTLPETFCL